MGTGQDITHLLHVAAGGRHAYASNSGSGTLSLFEQRLVPPSLPPTGVLPAGAKARLDWVQEVLPTGPGTEGFAVSPDERELWAVGPNGTLYVIDLATQRRVASFASGLDGAIAWPLPWMAARCWWSALRPAPWRCSTPAAAGWLSACRPGAAPA